MGRIFAAVFCKIATNSCHPSFFSPTTPLLDALWFIAAVVNGASLEGRTISLHSLTLAVPHALPYLRLSIIASIGAHSSLKSIYASRLKAVLSNLGDLFSA